VSDAGEVRDNKDRFRYELVIDGEVVAFLQYSRRGGRFLLLHTEVPDAYSGRGYATTLIHGTLDDLRQRGKEIVPICRFVESYIERNPEYNDMVDHEMFAALNAERQK
jgi:predicted GNAT family acetyltransferase